MKTLAITCPLFVNDLDAAIEFYTRLLGQSVQRRFAVAAKGIEVARIGDVLLIGGPNEALAPLRAISATLRVDTLDEYVAFLRQQRAVFVQEPMTTPVGRNMIVRGADGVTLEYVELRDQ